MHKKFGFLLFDKLEELDLIGPWELISIWGEQFGGPDNIFTISEQGGLVRCAHNLTISSDYSFDNCPKLDYLLIPGGMGTRTEVSNPILINFIRSQAKQCDYILSVCTGVFLLQAAHLLQNHMVTTHWGFLNELKQFSELKIQEKRFIKDGNIWSAAGISAGMDMALALIEDLAGTEIAGKVQLHAEYFPDQKRYVNLEDYPNLPKYLLN